MIHWIFVAATWAIGVFGVGGAIAAAIAFATLGPAAVGAVVEPVLAKFLACTKCIVAVVFVLATVGAYWIGHHEAENQCKADEANSVLAAARQDNINAQQAAADEANRANTIATESKDQHDKDLSDIESLKARPGCAFDDIDSGGSAAAGGVLSKLRAVKAKPAGRTK